MRKLLKTTVIILIAICTILSVTAIGGESLRAFANDSETINEIRVKEYSAQVNAKIKSLPSENELKSNSHFQNNCYFYVNEEKSNVKIFGDDYITNIIPKQYFTTVGEQILFNQQYGYYIKTQSKDNFLYSNVVMFDLINNVTNNNEIMAEINILFKMDYYYLTIENSSVEILWNNYIQKVIFTNGVANAVIPMPIYSQIMMNHVLIHLFDYKESMAINIADITLSTRLYNVNSANQLDNNYYDVANDTGYFITNNHVEYQATVTTGANVEQTLNDIGIELLLTGLGVVPYLGTVLTVANGAVNIINSAMTLATGVTYTEGKYAPSSNVFYGNKTEQVANYNHLIKSVTNKVESTESKKVRFNSGDFARSKTYITCENGSAPLQYTKAYVDIGLKVIDSSGSRAFIPVSLEYDINEPNEFILQEFSPTNYYILPKGSQFFSLTPMHNAEYMVRLNKDIDIYLNGSKLVGHLDPDNSNYKYYTFLLTSNQKYSISLKNNANTVKSDYFTITCAEALNKEFNILPNQEFLIKLPYNQGNPHNIYYTNNTNIKVIKAYNSSFSATAHNFNNYEIELNATETYYLLVKNTDTTNVQTLKFKKKEPIVIVPGNSTTQINVSGSEIYKKYKFTAPSNMTYFFTFDNKSPNNNYDAKFINAANNIKPYSLYNQGNKKSYKIGLAANEVIYFVINKYNNFTSNLLIDFSYSTSAAYQWIVNGSLITGSEIDVVRGQSIDVSLRLNNLTIPFNSEFIRDTSGSYNINGANNKLNIVSNCKIGRIELDFKSAWNAIIVGGTQYIDIPMVGINIKFEPTMSNSFSVYYSGDDFGLQIPNTNITSLNYTINYKGNNFSFQKIFASNRKISLKNDINPWTYSQPEFNIIVNKIWYNYTNKNGSQGNEAVNNITNGLNISNFTANCAFAGGSGTADSPYYVDTIAQFNRISALPNKSFKQGANINFNNNSHGLHSVTFNGVYDGNNFELTNINLTKNGGGDSGGLFRQNNGTIKNTKVMALKATIRDTSYFGGLVGINSGYLDNLIVTGHLNSTNVAYTGGIAGKNTLNIKNSKILVAIRTNNNAGLVVGENDGGLLKVEHFNRPEYMIMSVLELTTFGDYAIGGVIGVNRTNGVAFLCEIGSMVGYIGSAIKYNDTGSRAPRIGQVTGEDFATLAGRYAGTTGKNTLVSSGELKVVKNWLGLKPIDQARFVGGQVGKQN